MTATALHAANAENLISVANLLRAGGIAVIPTDTVYGLAADVLQPDAVRRVFEAKQRPADAPVPVLLAGAADLPLVVRDVPGQAWELIARYWPGALTLVLPARLSVDTRITAGTGKVAVRVPAHRACLQLLAHVGVPLTGTSANVSGMPPGTDAPSAVAQLGGKVDAILDGGVLGGLPSTVVELGRESWKVHREGVIPAEEIALVIGSSLSRVP